jgi:hypothetical protein
MRIITPGTVTGKGETHYLGMRNDLCEGKNRFKKLDYNALIDDGTGSRGRPTTSA